MTLPLNSRLSALYDTNGTQKDFSFGFRVFFDPDNGGYGLEVRRQTADGYEVIPKSDYLVLPVEDNSAGVVRFSVAPSAGQQIYIAGKTPTIQQLVLTNFGRYSAESIETQFDFITAIIQEWLSALGEETRQRIVGDQLSRGYVDSAFEDWKTWAINNVPLFAEGYISDRFLELKQEWIDAINHITSGEVPALAIPTSSGQNQQQVNDSVGAKWYGKPFGYSLHDRVMLENGDVVKSTVEGNTNNPNIDMTGWELEDSNVFVLSVTKLLTMKPKTGRMYNAHSYHDGGQLGGGSFIAVQSNMLTENGVTVFRSQVVGFEDYFWVRVNISHITPEMAGAIGDKAYNCRDAFQKCFNVGGDLRLNENSKYLVYGDGITTHRDTYILKCTKPISITCAGKASVYFKHDVITGSPRSITFEGVNENLASLKIEGVDWYGHETEGHANKVNRAWGIGLHGVDNYSIKRCKFSTFQGHCPDIARRVNSNNGDWIQSSDLNQANTSEAINRLMQLSSKNGVIENIKIRHAGSTGLAFFGADQVSVNGVDADMTGAAYDFSVWTDDASSQTALKDYVLNRGINIKNVKGGSIALTGCTTATVTGCDVHKVIVRSYDFDQQKNNFDSGTHTYNIDDHLSAPFLWMQNGGFVRRISIYSNCLNKLDIRSIFVDAYKNYFYSQSNGYEFVTCDSNSILWGNGSTYSDEYTSLSAGVKNNITANTFILNHANCVCVTFGTDSPNSYFNVTGSIIEKTNPAFVYTHMRNANQLYRRDSYYETGTNDGSTLSKTINHHLEVKQGLLTQGVGSNHLKTFVNIFGSASGGQTIANFKNTTTPVYFFVNLIDIAGRLFRKKIIVAADNTITVSDLDSQTIYNVSFSVTVTSGVIELKITSTGNDLCLDVIGLGTRGNCVFLVPKGRATSAG